MKHPDQMDHLLLSSIANRMIERLAELDVVRRTTHGERLFIALAIFDKVFDVWVKSEPQDKEIAQRDAIRMLLAEVNRIARSSDWDSLAGLLSE